MQLVRARNFTRGRLRPVRLVVVHTMESPEKPGTALAVARWFAGETAPQASAHWCIDDRIAVPCVDEADTAWGAAGANADAVHLEHAGRAGQGPAGWRDPYSVAVLATSAGVAAGVAARHGVPVRHLTDEQLAAGAAGFVGHDQVSRVFRRSDHTDPGPDFPWAAYVQLVAAQSPTQQEDDVLTDDDIQRTLDAAAKHQGLLDAIATRLLGGLPGSKGARFKAKDVQPGRRPDDVEEIGLTEAATRALAVLRRLEARSGGE